MAGKIVGSTIVPGNPSPGVTSAEIISLINKYGIGFGCNPTTIDTVSKLYTNSTTAATLTNISTGVGPAMGSQYVDIPAWSVESTLQISVNCLIDSRRTTDQDVDDNEAFGCGIIMGDNVRGSQIAESYGLTGQSQNKLVLGGPTPPSQDVCAHAFHQCFAIYTLPSDTSLRVRGYAKANGIYPVAQADALTLTANIKLQILRMPT